MENEARNYLECIINALFEIRDELVKFRKEREENRKNYQIHKDNIEEIRKLKEM